MINYEVISHRVLLPTSHHPWKWMCQINCSKGHIYLAMSVCFLSPFQCSGESLDAFNNLSVCLIGARQTWGGPERVSYTYLVLQSISGSGTRVKNKGGWAKRLPAGLLLANGIFHIPLVHLLRLNGSNVWQESGWVRSHMTDQTPPAWWRDGVRPVSVYCPRGQQGYSWSGVSTHSLRWPIRQGVWRDNRYVAKQCRGSS